MDSAALGQLSAVKIFRSKILLQRTVPFSASTALAHTLTFLSLYATEVSSFMLFCCPNLGLRAERHIVSNRTVSGSSLPRFLGKVTSIPEFMSRPSIRCGCLSCLGDSAESLARDGDSTTADPPPAGKMHYLDAARSAGRWWPGRVHQHLQPDRGASSDPQARDP